MLILPAQHRKIAVDVDTPWYRANSRWYIVGLSSMQRADGSHGTDPTYVSSDTIGVPLKCHCTSI